MIFLVGFMACGKSTLGQALKKALPRLRFIDLDSAVEEDAGCSVAEIFDAEGVEGFRKRESHVLRSIAGDADTIVACGGGTPCVSVNMDYMLASGTVIFLQADVDITVTRLLQAKAGQRPLVEKYRSNPAALKEYVASLLAERMPHYSRAHHRFDSSHLDTEAEINVSVEKFIDKYLS